MERPYSHSRPPTFSSKKKPPPFSSSSSSATSFNNGGFFTTSYDDVFGGPPKFASSSNLAPRAEDYTEIFGAFRSSSSSSRTSSSIPVLDLPAVPDDIHSAAAAFFDYSEVFGGFNAVDFAVPFDELFRPCDDSFCDGDGDGDGDGGVSSDEAWTPVGTESLSDDSDTFAFSEKSQCFSSGNDHQPSESKQFNVSYHKVNPGTSTNMPNTMHVAQLNDVSGYTCVLNEATSLGEMGKEKCSPEVDDIVLTMASPSELSQKHTRKTMSHASYDGTGSESVDSDRRSRKACGGSVSHKDSTFASVSELNLRTEPSHLPPPSRPPPVLEDRNGDFTEPNPGPIASEKYGFEAPSNGSLPQFFDMEVDASTFAAASAAAMKDAMEKAQAKLNAAKELRGKKDRVQSSGKLHIETDVIGGENVQGVRDECFYEDTRSHVISDRGPSKMKTSAKTRHAKTTSQNLPDILASEQPSAISGKPSETKLRKKSSLSMDTVFTDVGGQWKEARQYYEFVNTDDARLAPQPRSNNGDEKTATKQQGNDDHSSDSADEACVTGENRPRLKAAKAVSRQEYYEKMVKVAQDVHDSVICGHAEADKRLKRMSQGNPRQQKPELVCEPEKYEIPLCKAYKVEENPGEAMWKEEAGKRSKIEMEKEQCQKESEASNCEQFDSNAKVPHKTIFKDASEVKEGRMKGLCEKDEGAYRVQKPVVRGHEQSAEELCARQRTESRVDEAPKQKRNKETRKVVEKRSKETLEGVFIGDRMQTASASEEEVNTLQQMEELDKRWKEAFENESSRDRLQEACEGQEDNKTTNLQQRNEHVNPIEEAVDSQGSRKMVVNCVELEECQKNKESPKQSMRRPSHYESLNTIVDKKKSKEGQKDEIEEKLEKATELEHVEHKSSQACEQERSGIFDENTSHKEDEEGVHRSHINIEREDEDQGPRSSPDIKLPADDKHLSEKDIELDMSCKLKKAEWKTDGSKEESQVTPQKENGKIDSAPSDGKSSLEAVNSADVLTNERRSEPAVVEVGANDCELEGRKIQASDKLELNENNTDTGSTCARNEQTIEAEEMKGAQVASDHTLVKNSNVEVRGQKNIAGEGGFPFDHEEKVRSAPSEGINGYDEHAGKEEVAHIVLPDGKGTFQKISQQCNLGQSSERKGKHTNHNSFSEEKDEDKEIVLEKERLRKLEEERERMREREKDRMAVEIAVREARDRAFADARDRAERAALERATDEARQRAMAEARERLEKACAEARERSLADKTSEAKARAERAAVEQANAEARQRAIEKAMAERATFEARERMQRSVSEKISLERDVIMRQSSFPTTSERFEAANSEPAERCKARLERHRRTVERVAKALAEKNMRDLVAQREQAERTRFAETLDADIKRWSNGKEGNLRALLSTLQYILGPDSGWQPIPLTEVITAAAVKKAYRKATLCVHPDKLQQRGASIQQKYICEKDAWNRFNSEEK